MNLRLELTPGGALDDYRWLRRHGYWEQFDFGQFTKQYWESMSETVFVRHMYERQRLNKGAKPYKLAHALREARRYHESKDGGKSLREAHRASQGME